MNSERKKLKETAKAQDRAREGKMARERYSYYVRFLFTLLPKAGAKAGLPRLVDIKCPSEKSPQEDPEVTERALRFFEEKMGVRKWSDAASKYSCDDKVYFEWLPGADPPRWMEY